MPSQISNPPYRFCAQCGNDKLVAVQNTEHVCAACGFRHFINPIAAVVAILANPAGEVLLLRRARNPGQGLLGLPGGFVDVGETGEQALQREIQEEVGLAVTNLRYFISLPNLYRFQEIDSPVLDYFYTAHVSSFENATAKEEVDALVITHLSGLDFGQIAFDSNRRALKQYANRAKESQFFTLTS